MTTKAKPEVLKLITANGALLSAPVWEAHFRGSNWLAVIDIDGTCPGGLSRRWMPRGKGACLYLVEQLALFDAVEFAADYTTTAGKKRASRWFGVVKAITDDFILVEEAKSGAKAVLRAKEMRASPIDRAAAIRAEKDALLARVALLENEAQQLEAIETLAAPEALPS